MKILNFFAQIKNKINFISFDVIFLYILIGLVTFYTTAKVNKIHSFKPLHKLHSKVLSANNSFNTFFLYDTNTDGFIKKGSSKHITEFNQNYDKIIDAIRLIKKDNAELNLLSNNDFIKLDSIESKMKQYRNKFKELQLLYRKKGNENSGTVWQIRSINKKIRVALAETKNKEIKKILLNNHKLIFLYLSDTKHLDNSLASSKRLHTIISSEKQQEIITSDSLENPNDKLLSNIDLYISKVKEFHSINKDIGLYKNRGLFGDLINIEEIILSDIVSIKNEISTSIEAKIFKLDSIVIILILFFSIITFFIIQQIQKSITLPLLKIRKYTSELALGKFPEKIKLKNNDEITTVLKYINTLIDGLREKEKFANEIGQGNLNIEITQLSEDDSLSHSLEDMQKGLKDAHLERQKRQEEEQKQKWINTGIAEFASLLRQNNNNLKKLGDEIIRNLIHYVNANQGGIFLYSKDEENEAYMELISSYAFNRKKFTSKKVEIGEGLIGSIALEQKMIHLHKLPADYLEITSGLGEAIPHDLVIIPMVFNDVFYGALEIASFEKLDEHKIEFLKTITDNIASTFASVKGNIQTEKLLKQSNVQAEELASQEEEMRQNMEEIQATQEEASRREQALQELVDAVDASTYVIEYDAAGRVTRANRIVEEMLQLPNSEIVGKTINDFMDNSTEIAKIWEEVLRGKIIKNISKLVINGKTNWLNETYSPIRNEDGEIIKVLKFASDITVAKNLEEKVRKENEVISKQATTLKEEQIKFEEKELEIAQKNAEIIEIKRTIDNVLYYAELNKDMIFININNRFLTALDYLEDDLIGKNHDYISYSKETVNQEKILKELNENKMFRIKTFKQTKSGQEIHLYLTYTLSEDANNYKIILFGHETIKIA